MEAIILAGGFGTRLQSVVSDVPKPMAPIAGKPFLEILINSLSKKGFNHIVLSVGYKANIIQNYFGNQFNGVPISYSTEDIPLGTGGAVRLSLEKCNEENVFVLNGDTFVEFNINDIKEALSKHKSPLILGVEVPNANRYGTLVLSSTGQVRGFKEKESISHPGIINAGCYIIPRNFLNNWPLYTPFSLEKDCFEKLIDRINFQVIKSSGLFIDIGIPEDYQKAQSLLLNIN